MNNAVLVDSLGGPLVKNLSANAEDTGLVPGLGRSHMPLGIKACAQLLSPCSRVHERQLLKLSS